MRFAFESVIICIHLIGFAWNTHLWWLMFKIYWLVILLFVYESFCATSKSWEKEMSNGLTDWENRVEEGNKKRKGGRLCGGGRVLPLWGNKIKRCFFFFSSSSLSSVLLLCFFSSLTPCPSDKYLFVLCIYNSISVLLCFFIFLFLDSTYKWNYTVFIFLC